MSNVRKNRMNFNHQISISTDQYNLSGNAGMLLAKEFFNQSGLDSLLTQIFNSLSDERSGAQYSMKELMYQMIYMKIAGYANNSDANYLQYDPAMRLINDGQKFASQSTITRKINSLTESDINIINQTMLKLALLYIQEHQITEVVIDVDSSHCDTYGKQVNSAYNAHYATDGFHPLVAYVADFNLLLGIQLRPGNVYTSTGVVGFLEPIIDELKGLPFAVNVIVRGDSGFATPALYDFCENEALFYVIRLKANTVLHNEAAKVSPNSPDDLSKNTIQYDEFNYAAGKWRTDRRVIMKSTFQVGSLFYERQFVVTNLKDIIPELIFSVYQKRGAMEDQIKETKNGFFMLKTDSHKFTANAMRVALSGLAYNLISLLKLMVFQGQAKNKTIATLRKQIFNIAGKFSIHAHQIKVNLAKSNVYASLFFSVLHRIQQIARLIDP